MYSQLTSVLATLKQRTGINVEIINAETNYDLSERTKYNLFKLEVGNVFADEVENKTYFKFRFKDIDYVGMLDKATAVEKNYAYLTISFIENNCKDVKFSRNEGIKSIILGEYTKNQALRFAKKYNVDDVKCCVVLLSNKNQAKEIIDFMGSFLPSNSDVCVGIDDKTVALIKFFAVSDVGESFGEFLQMLSDNLKSELHLDVKIAVGSVVQSISEANVSFLQAQSTLRMSNVFPKKNNVYAYKEFALVRMLEEMPKFKIEEYLNELVDKDYGEFFNDEDMLKTCEEFLDNDLMISETSRKLFMHRNTLMYRLDKVENKTGLDIRHFSDAVTFRLIMILKKLNSQR